MASGGPDKVPVNPQDSIELFLNVFVLHTILSGNMWLSWRTVQDFLAVIFSMYSSLTFLPSISFFYPIPSLLFSHFLHLSFICSCFITLHGLLCVRVPPLFPSLPFFLSDCLSGIIALPQIAVLAGQKYSLHLCHKRQKIGVFKGRVEGAVLSYLA